MFIDKAQVKVQAGNGGDGLVSFRREKYISKGGPNGGDGGKGGDVILRASRNVQSLTAFRFQPHLKADDGGNGEQSDCHGRNGKKLFIDVPVGTVVFIGDSPVADLSQDGHEEVIARGGRGGFGNAHFKSSIRQAPRVAEVGEKGEFFDLVFELKMLADVGLVGMPNAGKSTLLSVVSSAKPKIANYPFTTLDPNIGLVDIDDQRFLMADIPGLIEGASGGKGLGAEFLRHIERTKVILHLVDANSNDPAADLKTITNELASHSTDLSKRQTIVVLTKIDGLDPEILDMQMKAVEQVTENKIMAISAQTHVGVKELLYVLKDLVVANKALVDEELEAEVAASAVPIIKLSAKPDDWRVVDTTGGFMVTGHKIEKFAERTRFGDYHAEQRLRDIIKKKGISRELSRRGAKGDSKIQFGRSGQFSMTLLAQEDDI